MVVMKNWEPLEFGPEFTMDTTPTEKEQTKWEKWW
jgi:hypothetical protein